MPVSIILIVLPMLSGLVFINEDSTKVVEDLKAKLQEVLKDCGEYSSLYTPSFTHYTEFVTASVVAPDKPDSCLGRVLELSTTTYNEVCLLVHVHESLSKGTSARVTMSP